MPDRYRKIADLPSTLAVFPLDGAIVFPRGALPLNIFEPRYLNMVDDAMGGSRIIGMIQSAGPKEDPARPRLAPVGTAARVTAYSETGDGRYLITLSGICRFRVAQELDTLTPYRQVIPNYEPFKHDMDRDTPALSVDKAGLLDALAAYMERLGLGTSSKHLDAAPLESLIDTLAAACPFEVAEKQALLEAEDLEARAVLLKALFETSGRTRLI